MNIEIQVRKIPVPALRNNHTSSKELKSVVDDEEVKWYWLLLSQHIESEVSAKELLTDIATLWVTIRGFSICSMWMEQYKKKVQKGISRHRKIL